MRLPTIARQSCLVILSLWSAIGSACANPDSGRPQESGQKEALEFLGRLEAESKNYVFRDSEGKIIEVRLGALHASDEALLHVSRVPTISRLLVGCTKEVTPAGLKAIGKLSSLRELELRVLGVSAPPGFMMDLGRLPNLESLDVSRMPLVEEDVRAIAGFPHLNSLRLYSVGLRDSDLPILRNVKGLVSLDITKNSLSDRGIRTLAPAPTSLRNLRAEDVTVSEETRKALDGVAVTGKNP